jgi:hypothetical protein
MLRAIPSTSDTVQENKGDEYADAQDRYDEKYDQ